MDALKDRSVIVYVSSNTRDNNWPKVPKPVQDAINSPEAGPYIPVVVVTDASMTKILSILPFVQEREERAKAIKKTVEAIRR